MAQAVFLGDLRNQALVDRTTRKLSDSPGGWSLLGGSILAMVVITFHAWLARAMLVEGDLIFNIMLSALMIIPFPLVIIWAFMGFLKQIIDDRAIEDHGTLVSGFLLSSSTEYDEGGASVLHKYCFSVDQGPYTRGQKQFGEGSLAGRPLPEPRTPVLIYYLDSKRHRML